MVPTKGHTAAECFAKPGECQSRYPHVEAVEMTKRQTADERIESAIRLGFVSYARAMREGSR